MATSILESRERCFFEREAGLAIYRRAICESVGTLLLAFAASGSGFVAHQAAPDGGLLSILVSAVAIAGALVGLIIAFGAVSGAHFNPLISLAQFINGERKLDCTIAYVFAQIIGACLGVLLANAVFGVSEHVVAPGLASWNLILSEFVDSAGLMIIVLGSARSGRFETGPFGVGAWLTAAIVSTPSTSYANPALTVGAMFSFGPIGLQVPLASYYILAQMAGGLVAVCLISITHPRISDAQVPERVGLLGAGDGI